jgi:hypothetical protein
MENTPLHPPVQRLDPTIISSGPGTYLTALPHTRSMFRSRYALRLTSLVLSLITLSLLAAEPDNLYPHGFIHDWVLAGVAAPMALAWDVFDFVYLGIRYIIWRRRGPRGDRGRMLEKDSWGHPGVHVAFQLIIWCVCLVMAGIETGNYRQIVWWVYTGYSVYGYRGPVDGSYGIVVAIAIFLLLLA